MPLRRSNGGLTLTELMIATALSGIAVLGVVSAEAIWVRVVEYIRVRSGLLTPDYASATRAVTAIVKTIERADRVRVIPGNSGIQLRVPDPCANPACSCALTNNVPSAACLDDPESYLWWQFAHDTSDPANPKLTTFVYRQSIGCQPGPSATRITQMSFGYRHEAPVPPGGDPFAPASEDNNVITYSVTWDNDPALSPDLVHTFRGEVILRNAAYTRGLTAPNVVTGLQDQVLDDTPFAPPDPACS